MAQQQADLQSPRGLDGATRSGLLRRRRRRQLNPRQRQGVLLVVVAAAGLVGVFLLIAGYVANVSKQVGSKIEILELTSPVPAYQPITANMLGDVLVPAKWAPHSALRDASQAIGLVSNVALPAGTDLEQGMLTLQPALQPGEREIAILVDAETGVARTGHSGRAGRHHRHLRGQQPGEAELRPRGRVRRPGARRGHTAGRRRLGHR
jgi:hypothetical protein